MNGQQIRACLEGDATYRRMFCGDLLRLPGDDIEQPKPNPVPGQVDPFRNADPIGSEWSPPYVPPAVNPTTKTKPFLSRLADIFDGIPNAPLGSPVVPGDCAWCRVTKKAGGYLVWIVVGLITAWLAKKWLRA